MNRDVQTLRWVCVLLVAVSAALATAAASAAPQPHINFVFPAGGRQGTTVEVKVRGLALKVATEVRVSGDGVTGKILASKEPEAKPDPKKKRPAKGKKGPDTETVSVSVTIAAAAAPGVRDLRLISPGGASNRYRFIVGQIPEVMEVEPNSTRVQAQRLPSIPVVVNGQLFGADADVFRFAAKGGQTIVCEVEGRKILPFIADAVPGWLQAVLTLYDAKGNEVVYVDDFRFKPDPVLICRIPKDGEYLVEIRDSIFRGREDFVYRLRIGELPYITHVYPLGAPRKTTASVKLAGANLDRETLNVSLPADGDALQYVGLTCKGLVANALPFGASDLTEANETEANDTPKTANRVAPGTVVNGHIQRPGDVDCFASARRRRRRSSSTSARVGSIRPSTRSSRSWTPKARSWRPTTTRSTPPGRRSRTTPTVTSDTRSRPTASTRWSCATCRARAGKPMLTVCRLRRRDPTSACGCSRTTRASPRAPRPC